MRVSAYYPQAKDRSHYFPGYYHCVASMHHSWSRSNHYFQNVIIKGCNGCCRFTRPFVRDQPDYNQLEEKQEEESGEINKNFLVEVDFFKGSIRKLISRKITFQN